MGHLRCLPSLCSSARFSSKGLDDRLGLPAASLFLLTLASTSFISHLFPVPPSLLPPHGLGTYIKLGVPLLFWPGAAKKRTGKFRLSLNIFIPVPSPQAILLP